jgi:hypothetical protein
VTSALAMPATHGAKVGRRDGMSSASTRAILGAVLPPPDASNPQECEDMPLDIAEQRVELSRLFRTYAKQARALHDTSPAEANTAGRLASVFAAALSRVTVPEPPRDPNEHPDMVAAAERFRAKAWEYVEKIQTGK